MMLYTKNGSIPQPETDGTEGWIPAPDKPECPEGKEVRWLNWEWVVRDPKPEDRPGYQWNWNHGEMMWVEGAWPATAEVTDIIEIVDVTGTSGTTSEVTAALVTDATKVVAGAVELNLGTTSVSGIETVIGGG